MRPVLSNEMMNLIAFFAVLLVFFSIDVRGREVAAGDPLRAHFFAWTSRLGGVMTAVALALGWVDVFIPDEQPFIHVGLIAIPGSLAVLCAIALGIELLFQHE